MELIRNYLISFGLFMIIDLIWLGFIAKDLYGKALGHLMSPKVKWSAASLFYFIFIFGIQYFVLNPALIHQDLSRLIVDALMFGFLTYATYDLTNLATLKDWPLKLTFIDLIWGSSLSLLVSFLSYILIQWL